VANFDRAAVMPSPRSGRFDGVISDRPARQFYLSSIIGGSFAFVTADSNPPSILTAGGAMDIAFDHPGGRLRIQAEGRYRDPIERTYLGFNRESSRIRPRPELIGIMQARASGGWSAMANIGRDFQLTDRIDAFGGVASMALALKPHFSRLMRLSRSRLSHDIVPLMIGRSMSVVSGTSMTVSQSM
jgi:hypothetical protein